MGKVVILGVFVADTSYRAARQPKMGETIIGKSFVLGPGGKGSNQAVAAAMAGAETHFISGWARMPLLRSRWRRGRRRGFIRLWCRIRAAIPGRPISLLRMPRGTMRSSSRPGLRQRLLTADVDANAGLIRGAAVFITQLEQPIPVALHALKLARAAGVVTILNPAPAAELPAGMVSYCDYVTPNETEAEALTGIAVTSLESAEAAARALLAMGAGAAILTLGEKGALFHDGTRTVHVPPFNAGPVVETTGAGDAFNGGFAAALAEGMDPVAAVRFGSATAGISVTRAGTAPSMPSRAEIEALLAR